MAARVAGGGDDTDDDERDPLRSASNDNWINAAQRERSGEEKRREETGDCVRVKADGARAGALDTRIAQPQADRGNRHTFWKFLPPMSTGEGMKEVYSSRHPKHRTVKHVVCGAPTRQLKRAPPRYEQADSEGVQVWKTCDAGHRPHNSAQVRTTGQLHSNTLEPSGNNNGVAAVALVRHQRKHSDACIRDAQR